MRFGRFYRGIAESWVGTPYGLWFSAASPEKGPGGTIDCSTYVREVLREGGFPSLPNSNVQMLVDSPLFIHAPLRLVVNKGGVLLWGWQSIKAVNMVQSFYDDNEELLDTYLGLPRNIMQMTSRITGLGGTVSSSGLIASTGKILALKKLPVGAFMTAMDRAASSLIRAGQLVSNLAYRPIQSSYHHMGMVFDRRNVYHSTIRGGVSGAQIQPLSDFWDPTRVADPGALDAFADLFTVGVNMVTTAYSTFTLAYDWVVRAVNNPSEIHFRMPTQITFEAVSGVFPAMLNFDFLSKNFTQHFGPTWSEAVNSYNSDVSSILASDQMASFEVDESTLPVIV